jgi:TPR repeat protein
MDGDLGPADVPNALRYMEQAYHDGESLGALTLAQRFESGRQVIPNMPVAVRWYQKASEMGNFFATHRLQVAYTLGELGLPRDPELATRYQSAFNAQTDTTAEDANGDSNPSQP